VYGGLKKACNTVYWQHKLSIIIIPYCLAFGITSAVAEEIKSNQTEAELDELLQGFDDKPAVSNEPNLEELLDGFDDNATPSKQDENLDQLISGFEEAETTSPESLEETASKPWYFTTLTSLSSAYNYQHTKPAQGKADFRGLSRLKFKIQPELRYQINSHWDSVLSASAFYDLAYRIQGRSQYEKSLINSNESEAELREFYVRGTLTDNFDIKIGRQIVVWGKSDSIRVVDIVNPLDFREPGMVDIEDLRLPVTMLKADYYFGDWNLSTIIIPEIRFNKTPAFGSDFNPSQNRPAPEQTPDSIKNPELAIALNGVFSGWDLSFHAAKFYDDQAHSVLVNGATNHLSHSQLHMLGAATNIALSHWLFKSEFAWIDGLEFANSTNSFSRNDLMIGVDYAGITNMTFSVEFANRHINNYKDALKNRPDQTERNSGQFAFRYSASFLREKLEVVALASILGTDLSNGAFYRGSLEYEIQDAMTILVGAIVYQAGDEGLLNKIAKNDRIFFDWRYTF